MDTLRKLAWLSLGIVSICLWQAWQKDYGSQLLPIKQDITQRAPATAIQLPAIEKFPIIPKERQITFQTDVIKGMIDTQGGHLVYLALLNYPKSIHTNDPFVLLDHRDSRYYKAETDLLNPSEHQSTQLANQYQSTQSHYLLASDKETICIVLNREENGVKIAKQFLLKKGNYQIDVSYRLNNSSKSVYQTQPYAQLVRGKPSQRKSWLNTAYLGGILSSDSKRYQKVAFDSLGKKPLPQHTSQAWLSFVEPYFASAWISKLPNISYYSQQRDDNYILGMLGDSWTLEPGESATKELSLYVGPKVVEILRASATHLDLLVDYGIFWFIAINLFWLLKQCYFWLGNWGWAIVCATILLKLSLYPIAAKQFHATWAMRRLQTKLNDLKARYGNDQQALSRATIELYRREGVSVNPFKGIVGLIQLPISLALYAVLSESVELRHEPFILWIKDLAATDPYYIFPILLGISMFIEVFIDQILTVSQDTADESLNTMLLLVPCIFALAATNFPTGVALYWLVQNVLSSLQKWWLLGKPVPKRINTLLSRFD